MRRSHAALTTAAIVSVLLALAACSGKGRGPHSLATIKARGTLVVLTLNSPTTWYVDSTGRPAGPEYRMVIAFAKFLGVQPKFVFRDSVAQLLHALALGDGDMVAAGITRTDARAQHFGFGPSYQKVTQQVVCRRGGPLPTSPTDLNSLRFAVVAGSSYAERLRTLKKKYPDLHWRTARNGVDTQLLLRRVWEDELDCTIADSNIVAINRRYFPNLIVAFDLGKAQQLAWVTPQGAHDLRAAMRHWFDKYRASGALAALMKHYYAHAKVFDYVNMRAFARKIKSSWPTYKPLFEKAGAEYGIPPLILAAQAWQESRWNPHAESPTGVRGIMMLTSSTARAMGVANRMNPAASIRGGAKYLAHVESRLGGDIRRSDRIWFALAAYNIGLFHLRDAIGLTRKLGKDPSKWSDVAQVLPLLSEKRYYKHLHYGYARGLEAVRYVRRVRSFANILQTRTGGTREANRE